jgi:hypothetical protein
MSTLATQEHKKDISKGWGLFLGSTASSFESYHKSNYFREGIVIIDTSSATEDYIEFPIDTAVTESTRLGLESNVAHSFYDFKDKENDLSVTRQIEWRIYRLEKIYDFINPPQIRNYLGSNIRIIEILEHIPLAILDYFATNEVLTLELLETFQEPEPPKLRITIITELNIVEANGKLKDFRINRLFKKFDPITTNIMVTLGFQ